MEGSTANLVYYGTVFAIGAIIAACRVVRDHDSGNLWDLLAISVQGGFWSFGVVGVLGHYWSDINVNHILGMALSALVGLAGKEQDKYLRQILRLVWDKFGLPKEE